MTLYEQLKMDEKLTSTLERVRSMDDANAPSLTVECIGLLQAFLHSDQRTSFVEQGESALVEKAEHTVQLWAKRHHSKAIPKEEAQAQRKQMVLRTAMSRLRGERYEDLTRSDLSLLRGTLESLAGKQNKYNSDLRLEKLITEGLSNYDKHIQKVGPKQPKQPRQPRQPEQPWNPRQALASNWYLILAAVALCVFASYMMARPQEPVDKSVEAKAQWDEHVANHPGGALAGVTKRQPGPSRQTAQVKAQAIIAEHEQTLQNDPSGPDAPVLRNAMGNLHFRKLKDYGEAARHFELLIAEYPDWDGARGVYPKLAACYTKLNMPDKAHAAYWDMLEAFPEGSQEHLFAQQQLGLAKE